MKREVVFMPLSNTDPEPIDWIWRGRLARGKVTLIFGDPDLGKSQISIDIAARITTATEWPDGAAGIEKPARVLFLSAEDDGADTIRPRLDAAGADPKLVEALHGVFDQRERRSSFNLQEDIEGQEGQGGQEFPLGSVGTLDPHRERSERVGGIRKDALASSLRRKCSYGR